MILRDLVSRFSFKIDKKDVADYDKTIGGMSKKALKLGAFLGGAVSLKSMLDVGKSARQAREDVRRLAGTDFYKLQSNLIQIRSKLDNVRKGTGEQLTNKDFNVSLAGFIQQFGKGETAIENFRKMLFSVSLQATATGQNITKEFSKAMSFIKNGDVDAFKNLPNFTAKKKSELDYRLNAITPKNEPSGEVGRSIRTSELLKQYLSINPILKENVKNLSANSFEETRRSRLAVEGSDKATEEIDKHTAPISNAFNDAVVRASKLNKESFFGKIDKEGRTESGKSWDSFPDDMRRIFSGYVKEHNDKYGNIKSEKLINKIQPTNSKQVNEIHNNTNIKIEATYKVDGTNSKTIDTAVKNGINKAMKEAERQIERTE